MEAFVINGYRSAVAKSKRGGFKNYRSDDLAVDVISNVLKNNLWDKPKYKKRKFVT